MASSDIPNLTRAEVAALLRCSVDTVDKRIADGSLPAFKTGAESSSIAGTWPRFSRTVSRRPLGDLR